MLDLTQAMFSFVHMTKLLLHNRDLSEYVILYKLFDKSFNYHKQLLRNYKNIKKKLVANTIIILPKMLKQIMPKG